MKIFIGKYRSWVGVYQLASLLKYVGVSEDKCHEIGGKAPQWLVDFAEWIHSKKHRKVKIKIHDYDTWNANDTMAMIIHPILVKLKEDKHGSPFTTDEFIPTGLNLRTDECEKPEDGDTDDNFHKRWSWILDEMIWAFEQHLPDNDWEDQYHSGVIDFEFVPCEDNPEMSKMESGPNDTHKFDSEGYRAHSDRIERGTRLFGLYYSGLWS